MRKAISLLLIICIISIPSTAFGANNNNNVVNYATFGSPVVTEAQQHAAMLEAEGKVYDLPEAEIFGPDPGVGSIRIVPYRYSNGYLTEQASRNGIYSNIKNVVLLVVGTITSTVSSIVISVADMLLAPIYESGVTTAKTYISYSYFGKDVQVYNSGGAWQLWFDSRSRDTYKHYFASYVSTDGYTKTGQKDFIPPNGYSATLTEYSPHYFDDNWLSNKAYTNWLTKEQYYANKIEYWYQ